MSVKLISISKYYGSQAALKDVSFEIGKGQIAGFIGPNGAGKSTAMKIITGIIPASSGEVWINGEKADRNPLSLREITGYLPENNPLYTDMYVREYLEYAALHYRLGRNRGARIAEIIEMTGLGPESHKKISQLSKGYKQRVGLAQALIHDPGILILDEPTSGLDPGQIVEIRNLISEIGKQKTVILSTHIMQEVEAICDRVIIIRQGSIVADGKPGEITAADRNAVITLHIEFDRAPVSGSLESVPGVIRIKYLSDTQILAETDSSTDIRPVMFNFAVKEGLTVLSMQRKEKSLEELFLELTR